MPTVWTIGHSNVSLDDFISLLERHGIEQVADVRRYPASRRHPHFNRETLATVLQAREIAYRWFEDLGGRRPGLGERSPNRGLESAGFRSYADYMLSREFSDALGRLIEWSGMGRTVLLCAEALWWRCHRRLLGDALVRWGGIVIHIQPDGETARHELWDLAVPVPDGLVYPPIQSELELESGR